jgi:hypothetical protein
MQAAYQTMLPKSGSIEKGEIVSASKQSVACGQVSSVANIR